MGVEGELENWRSFAIPHCKIEFESYFIWNNLNLKMIHRPIKLEMKEQGELEKLWKSTKHWPHWVWWWDISFENNLNNWTTNNLKITLNRNQIGAEGARRIWGSFENQSNFGQLDLEERYSFGYLKMTWKHSQYNRIGDEGAQRIGEALPSLKGSISTSIAWGLCACLPLFLETFPSPLGFRITISWME